VDCHEKSWNSQRTKNMSEDIGNTLFAIPKYEYWLLEIIHYLGNFSDKIRLGQVNKYLHGLIWDKLWKKKFEL
jgi:hypothetical protein